MSQSVKPRFNTFSFSRGETPPGCVLKAWISQVSLERAGTCRSLRPREVRVIQEAEGEAGRLWAERFGEEDFVGGMKVQV